MGNDLASDHDMDGAQGTRWSTTLDLHYAYLTGLQGMGGWPDWNANGGFVDIMCSAADSHGVTPMFTLYSMAAQGEGQQRRPDARQLHGAVLGRGQAAFPAPRRLRQAVGHAHRARLVGGFIMQSSPDGKAAVHVTSLAPDCGDSSNDVIGMAGCLRTLARKYSPQTKIGFHVSQWGGTASAVISFFKAIGADQADFIATDMLDRDAGCYEAHTDPNCQRTDGPWYFDETNTTSPNYTEHLAWVTQMTQGIGLPMMWWQVPFGVPSTTQGGTSGHYRDNRVHYMFSHVPDFIAAGGVGSVWGTGAANQTYITTDGDQFKNAVSAYFANPTAL